MKFYQTRYDSFVRVNNLQKEMNSLVRVKYTDSEARTEYAPEAPARPRLYSATACASDQNAFVARLVSAPLPRGPAGLRTT